MTVTTSTLTRAAAVAAMAGGLLFIAVQIKHPHLTADFVTTREYAVRETMKIVMAVLSLIGITGIYLRQVRQTGVLGLVGYVVLGLGYLAILSNQVVAVFVLPILAPQEPEYVTDVLGVATSRPPVGDIGALQSFIQLGGFAYIRRRRPLRRRSLPRRDPRPLGRSAAGRRRRRHDRDLRAAGAGPTAVRLSGQRRPGRPRLLAVARAAHPGLPPLTGTDSSRLDPAGAR